MQTATAILSTLPGSFRLKRQAAGDFNRQIANLADHSASTSLRQLAYGVQWADFTGRTTGTVSLALRKATPWQAAQLMVAMIADGLEVPAEVPSWLNQRALALLA
jgi:hypothetical protein